jgi:anti-sigma factor RsiW
MQELLHAYADGELDLAHALDVERHLQGCPDCSRACAELRELRAALHSGLPRFAPPDDLRDRVRGALRQQHTQGRRPARGRWPLVALAASLLVVAAGVGALASLWPAREDDRVAQQVVDSHVRSQLVSRHLLDVESSDRHTVKPWFQGRLDFAPVVRDLRDQGFILAGGRLDYVNGRPVAAVVYRRDRHVVNVLSWPASPGAKDVEPRSETRQGFHLVHWRRQRMNRWAVSDLNLDDLNRLAQLLGGRD